MYLYDPDYGNRPFPYMFGGIPNTLEAMDWQVSYLNTAAANPESFQRDIQAAKPDLLLGFVQHRTQVMKIASFLKEYHPAPAVNWYQEEPNSLFDRAGENVIEASASFDLWFGIDNKMVPFWKTKAFFLPPAFDQQVFQDPRIERVYDVSYIGQLGPSYLTKMYWPYMNELARYGKKALMCIERPMGLPLLPRPLERFIRSPKRRRFLQRMPFWKCTWINPADEHQRAHCLNQSRIHFGMNRVLGKWEQMVRQNLPDYPLDKTGLFYQLKSRPFQAAGAGAMVINEYCPELEELFDVGKEIVTFEFGHPEEVREKIKWYLEHDQEREKVARAGYERAHRDHTYIARLNYIMDCIRRVL